MTGSTGARPLPPPRIERLAAHHAIAGLTCGEAVLDVYFHQHAAEDE